VRFLRLALTIVAAAVMFASCVPVAPPPVSQYCAPSTPSSAGGYQAAFNNLRLTYTEWITADDAVPISLPDGRVLWLFGDTFTGRTNPDGSVPANAGFIHNSFVLQSGPCFAPLMGGAAHARASLIPDPAPNEWYWPAGGVVDGGVVRVFLWHMRSAPSSAPGLGFSTIDMQVASYSLPFLQLLSIQPLPFPTGANGATPPYGATALSAPDGFVYLYGAEQGNTYVARTPAGHVPAGPWEFFDGSSWSSNPAQAAPMSWPNSPPHNPVFGSGAGPVAQPWVVPYKPLSDPNLAYLATAEPVDAFSNQVFGYTAPTPAGPWTYQEVIASAPSNMPSYGAATRFNLPGTTSPVVIYSVNNLVFSSGPTSIFQYGPWFMAPITLP
jgi:hypothetical protein